MTYAELVAAIVVVVGEIVVVVVVVGEIVAVVVVVFGATAVVVVTGATVVVVVGAIVVVGVKGTVVVGVFTHNSFFPTFVQRNLTVFPPLLLVAVRPTFLQACPLPTADAGLAMDNKEAARNTTRTIGFVQLSCMN